jgi:hypothetical protein
MVVSVREIEARRGSISMRRFTFLAAPLMVVSAREIEAFRCISHVRERGKKRRHGREAPTSSLLLQRKEDR